MADSYVNQMRKIIADKAAELSVPIDDQDAEEIAKAVIKEMDL